MTKPRLLDLFCGEGGAAVGYAQAGFNVVGVDNSEARLDRYPFESMRGDAIAYVLEHGHEYDAIHASPPCTGYSRGTVAIPDRLRKYDRLIGVAREAIMLTDKPYVIENVEYAKPELRTPAMLCGRMFGLDATDDDGTYLVLDRHRLFETSFLLMTPPHEKHDKSLQVAGSYSGGRRDKVEARMIRKGGYVPKSADIQRVLLGTPWMSERGCMLSIPPAYSAFVGEQLMWAVKAGR